MSNYERNKCLKYPPAEDANRWEARFLVTSRKKMVDILRLPRAGTTARLIVWYRDWVGDCGRDSFVWTALRRVVVWDIGFLVIARNVYRSEVFI